MANEAPCPRCGWPVAIFFDSPASVGSLWGYYLSHEPWVPYPKWTNCPVYDAVKKMDKFDTEAKAEQARTGLAATGE